MVLFYLGTLVLFFTLVLAAPPSSCSAGTGHKPPSPEADCWEEHIRLMEIRDDLFEEGNDDNVGGC